MNAISTLSDYLVYKMQAISGIDPQYVFDYENAEMNGFPWVTVVLNDFVGEFVTNAQNLRTYNFTIRVYQEISSHLYGADNGEQRLRTLGDSIISALDADYRLGNRCIYSNPISARYGWLQDRPVRTFEITLEAKTIEGIIFNGENPMGTDLYAGQVRITASGVQTQFPSNVLAQGVVITAATTNAGIITLGDTGVSTANTGSGTGYVLLPGQSTGIAVSNTNLIYINGDNAGDFVTFNGA